MASIAKILRRKSTDTENLLWKHLRAKQIEGLKFRRQEATGTYIVDFVCYEKRIVIEVDGGQHSMTENEVLTNIEGVLEVIRGNCLDHPPLAPPIKGGGKKQVTHRKA